MKAVRFSLPPETDSCDETERQADDEERGYADAVSRNGSQQHLAEQGAGREVSKTEKTANPFLCGVCCTKAPAVSVWNCDGELLSSTEILCR